MNLIKYLQAGGFVLPQYSQGALSFQNSGAGTQMIDRLNNSTQQGLNNYIQLENLNLQNEQVAQSAFNSVITNKLAVEREQRINKQTDLTNKRLELDQLREADNILNEMMKYDEDNYLQRDRAAIEKLYKDNNVDMETIMKNSNDLNYLMKTKNLRKQLGTTHKTAFTNKMKVKDAADLLGQAEQYEKQLGELEKRGVPLNIDEVTAFTDGFRNSYNELLQFKQGTLADLNMEAPHWQQVMSMPDFVNRVKQEEMYNIKIKAEEAEMQARQLNAESSAIRAAADKQEADIKLQMLPAQQQETILKGFNSALKNANVLVEITKAIPGVNTKDPMAVLDAIGKATPAQLESLSNAFKAMDDDTKAETFASLQAAYATGVARGWSDDKLNKILSALQMTQNKTTNMNYSGIPARNDGGVGRGTNDAPVTNKDGTLVDYGTYQINNKTGEVTHITVGNKSYDLSQWTKAGEVMAQVEEVAPKGSGKKAAVLRINYNSEQGMKFLQFNVGARKDGETNKQWAERYLRATLSAQGAPKDNIDRLVKNGLEVDGIVRVARDTKNSGQTTKSTTPNPAATQLSAKSSVL